MVLTRRDFVKGAVISLVGIMGGSGILRNSEYLRFPEPVEGKQNETEMHLVDSKPLPIVHSGFSRLDEVLNLVPGGSLILMASREPGLGKTELALDMAVNAAGANILVQYFNLQHTTARINKRINAAKERVIAKSSTSPFGENQHKLWEQTSIPDKLLVDDCQGISVSEIRKKVLETFEQYSPNRGLIIVDYLQLLEPDEGSNFERRNNSLEAFGLKLLAGELNIPIVVCSQGRRTFKTCPDKPVLHVLREMGLELDPDVCLLLERSNEIFDQRDTTEHVYDGSVSVHVAKNRYGERDMTIPLLWE